MGAFVSTKNTFKKKNLYAAAWLQFPTFPRMLAAQAGSFVSMILIKPLVRQPSETNAERGVNLPRQQWDVRAQMSDRAGISAEPHPIPAQTASARDSDHYVTAPETLRG